MDQTEPLGKPSDIFVILDHPQLAENIGMSARAMANTGFLNLRLVNPQCGWPNEKINLASAEKLHLLNCKIFDTLENAIADLQYTYATTARNRNMVENIFSPDSAAEKIHKSNEKIGIVFGNEKSGLSNDDVSFCNAVIEIPSVNFSSYNLAQAVLIICYSILHEELSKKFDPRNFQKLKIGKSETAPQKQLDFFLHHLEASLEQKQHFPTPEKQTQMMLSLRNFFKRASPTAQEVQSLLGVINSLIRK